MAPPLVVDVGEEEGGGQVLFVLLRVLEVVRHAEVLLHFVLVDLVQSELVYDGADEALLGGVEAVGDGGNA